MMTTTPVSTPSGTRQHAEQVILSKAVGAEDVEAVTQALDTLYLAHVHRVDTTAPGTPNRTYSPLDNTCITPHDHLFPLLARSGLEDIEDRIWADLDDAVVRVLSAHLAAQDVESIVDAHGTHLVHAIRHPDAKVVELAMDVALRTTRHPPSLSHLVSITQHIFILN